MRHSIDGGRLGCVVAKSRRRPAALRDRVGRIVSQRRFSPALATFRSCRGGRQAGVRAVADRAATRVACAAARSTVPWGSHAKGWSALREIRWHLTIPDRGTEATTTQALPGVPPDRDRRCHWTVTHHRSRSRRCSRGRLRRWWKLGFGRMHPFFEFLHLANQASDLTERSRFWQSRVPVAIDTVVADAASTAVIGSVVESRHARTGGGRWSSVTTIAICHRRGTRMSNSLRTPGSMQGPRVQRFASRCLLAWEARGCVNGLSQIRRRFGNWRRRGSGR